MKRALSRWILALMALVPMLVSSHEMSIGELELRELAPGEFSWLWSASSDKRPAAMDLTPQWPGSCTADASLLHCGKSGLQGTFSVEGVGKNYSAVLMRVYWLDGQVRVYTVSGAQPRVQLYGKADDPRGRAQIAFTYLLLGVEHILTGYDHLLFVLSLLFLVGFSRKLIWTITAFTAAHSLTLASAALGLLTLRPAPVEASIALSIVLVAGEALGKRQTLSQKWPAVVAFLFGLVHGLGFAGALKELGLPANYFATALVTFNAGVEAGQLMAVFAAWLIWRQIKRWPASRKGRTPVLYGIGALAAYWSWIRVIAILG